MQNDPANTIFVANIPFHATEESITEFFESFRYRVRSTRIVYDHGSGKSRGIAYIEFHDSAMAKNAIHNMNYQEMSGRQLKVAVYGRNVPYQHRLSGGRFIVRPGMRQGNAAGRPMCSHSLHARIGRQRFISWPLHFLRLWCIPKNTKQFHTLY